MQISSKLISTPLAQSTCLEPRNSFFNPFLALLAILIKGVFENVSIF